MPKQESSLIRNTRHLIRSTKELRAALLDYQRACEALVTAGRPGQPPNDTIEMLERLRVAERRERVSSAVDAFEAARHDVRLELVVAAQEDGRNLSDVARALGVSRQLTSRLGAEARHRKG